MMQRTSSRSIVLSFVAALCAAGPLTLGARSAGAQTPSVLPLGRADLRLRKETALAAQRFARINGLLVQLSLTADQKARIAALQLEAQRQIAGLRAERSLAPAARKEQVQGILRATLAQTHATLRPIQKRRLKMLAAQERLLRQTTAPGTNVLAGSVSSPTMVTADGEEVQF